jgi:hypothetical protein
MAHQQSFFDGRTSNVSEPTAQQLLADVNPLLWQSIMAPWDDFQVSRRDDPRFRDLNEGEAAWWLHTQVKRMAQTLCDDSDDLGITAHTTNDNQFYLNLRNELVLVFKKLVRVYSRKQRCHVFVRRNYPTKHNCEFWEQRAAAGINAPRLVVGYLPIKALTEARVFIGYPRTMGRRFDWIYEMPDQAKVAYERFARRRPDAADSEIDSRGFTVFPKPNQADERGAV